MKTKDPYEEWFQRNWYELIVTYGETRPNMTFDVFCNGRFMERKEPLNPMLIPYS